MKKILAIVVMSIMILSLIASVATIGAAEKVEDQDSSFVVTKAKYNGVKNIPILGIVASFDADGDGENDYDPKDTDKLYSDVTQKYYGEQWAITKPSDHYDKFFKEGDTKRVLIDEFNSNNTKLLGINEIKKKLSSLNK